MTMRRIALMTVALSVIISSVALASASNARNKYAPDGLHSITETGPFKNSIPGGGALLFCGKKFITLSVVGTYKSTFTKQLIPTDKPHLMTYRMSDIRAVYLDHEHGASVFFKVDVWREGHEAGVHTRTSAKAILECLG